MNIKKMLIVGHGISASTTTIQKIAEKENADIVNIDNLSKLEILDIEKINEIPVNDRLVAESISEHYEKSYEFKAQPNIKFTNEKVWICKGKRHHYTEKKKENKDGSASSIWVCQCGKTLN